MVYNNDVFTNNYENNINSLIPKNNFENFLNNLIKRIEFQKLNQLTQDNTISTEKSEIPDEENKTIQILHDIVFSNEKEKINIIGQLISKLYGKILTKLTSHKDNPEFASFMANLIYYSKENYKELINVLFTSPLRSDDKKENVKRFDYLSYRQRIAKQVLMWTNNKENKQIFEYMMLTAIKNQFVDR